MTTFSILLILCYLTVGIIFLVQIIKILKIYEDFDITPRHIILVLFLWIISPITLIIIIYIEIDKLNLRNWYNKPFYSRRKNK